MTYKIPKKQHRLKGPNKRTNDPKNPYFAWLRNNRPECVVCGAPGEIHHIDVGLGDGDDSRVVMCCSMHHSAQSNDGLHKSPSEWYKRFIAFDDLEQMATDNHIAYLSEVYE